MDIDEERHSEQVGRSTRAETAGDETFVDRLCPRTPAGRADAAGIDEATRRVMRKPKAVEPAAMQEVGVFDGSDQSKATSTRAASVSSTTTVALRKAGKPIP